MEEIQEGEADSSATASGKRRPALAAVTNSV